jgi:hypothetical protein
LPPKPRFPPPCEREAEPLQPIEQQATLGKEEPRGRQHVATSFAATDFAVLRSRRSDQDLIALARMIDAECKSGSQEVGDQENLPPRKASEKSEISSEKPSCGSIEEFRAQVGSLCSAAICEPISTQLGAEANETAALLRRMESLLRMSCYT